MGSKKKKGSKANVDSGREAVQPAQPDMSKYANAYSNKSKINYAELKLLRPAQTKASESSDDKTDNKNRKGSDVRSKKAAAKKRKAKERRAEEPKRKQSGTAGGSEPKSGTVAGSAAMSAEERYSNALGKEDHYSSAVEKYYLKYPDAKRPKKSSSRRSVSRTKKKTSVGSGTSGKNKLSMAEIAVRNKSSSSVKKHARAARNAKARGVVSPQVANHPFYPRKKKRSGAFKVLMVTLLLAFLASVGVTVFFNIRTVNVQGENPYGDDRIKSVCGIHKGGNIIFLSTEEIEKKVEKELPYIEECWIERRLPSTVVINVRKADVLGVAQASEGQWTVLSYDGKILETITNRTDVSDNDTVGTPVYSADYSSAEDVAESRKLPALSGLDVRSSVENGYITNNTQFKHIRNFTAIKKAFEKWKMRLTAISYGKRGYEAEFDKRIKIIFGKELDPNAVVFRVKEVHSLIYDEGYINEDAKGEIKFNGNNIFFRPEYQISDEEIELIHEERRRTNRKQLYQMAEVFMATGEDWLNGNLKNE